MEESSILVDNRDECGRTPAFVAFPATGTWEPSWRQRFLLPLSSRRMEANNPCNPMRNHRSPDPPSRRPFSHVLLDVVVEPV